MSREVDTSKKLSRADRAYLVERGRMADVEANDKEFGSASQEEDLDAMLEDAMSEVTRIQVLIGERDARAGQEAAGVVDNTVVNGEGGTEDEGDWYENHGVTNEMLRAELKRRELSTEGNKAALVERLRANDYEDSEE